MTARHLHGKPGIAQDLTRGLRSLRVKIVIPRIRPEHDTGPNIFLRARARTLLKLFEMFARRRRESSLRRHPDGSFHESRTPGVRIGKFASPAATAAKCAHRSIIPNRQCGGG